MRTKYGVVFGGFAIKDGIFNFNSNTLNCSILQGPNGTHDYFDKKMSQKEMRLISNAIWVAKEKDRIPNLTINIRDFE